MAEETSGASYLVAGQVLLQLCLLCEKALNVSDASYLVTGASYLVAGEASGTSYSYGGSHRKHLRIYFSQLVLL